MSKRRVVGQGKGGLACLLNITLQELNDEVSYDKGRVRGNDHGGHAVAQRIYAANQTLALVNWLRMADQVERVQRVSREEAVRRKFKLNDGQSPGGDAQRPMLNTPYGAYGTPFLSVLGAPCNAPPWGLISAVDLGSGKLLWSKPLGTARDTGPLGIPSMLPLTIGTPMSGGSVTTRSGLIFIAATTERTLRALDVRTGTELWSARLPGGGNASPMTYKSPRSGRQFVVIAAGGKKALKTRVSNKIVAFALPER